MKFNKYARNIPEISSLPEAEQEAMMEKARYEAFVSLGLSRQAALYFIICLILGFSIAAFPILFLDVPILINVLFLSFGLFIANLTYGKLYQALLIRGLNNVIAKSHHR